MVSSQEVFDQILDLYLRAELASDSNLKVLEVTLTIKKGPLKAFSEFVGDRGVQVGCSFCYHDQPYDALDRPLSLSNTSFSLSRGGLSQIKIGDHRCGFCGCRKDANAGDG